eukprot:Pgem_evm1s2764
MECKICSEERETLSCSLCIKKRILVYTQRLKRYKEDTKEFETKMAKRFEILESIKNSRSEYVLVDSRVKILERNLKEAKAKVKR